MAKMKCQHCLIAGTVKAHDLALATRNTADFQHLDIDLK